MRVAFVVALLAAALTARSAQGQTPQEQYPRHRIANERGQTAAVNSNRLDALASDTFVTGTITSTQSVVIGTQGRSNLRVAISGTWTGAIVFEGSVDGTNWITNGGLPFPVTLGGGAITSSTSVNGQWESRVAGFRLFRMRGNTVTSGTAVVAINASVGNDYTIANLISDGTVIANSSTPLAAGATWTSGTIDMLPFVSETVFVYSDQPSATNGAVVELSLDGVTWFNDHASTYGGGYAAIYTHERRARYMRTSYTNGAAPQGVFAFTIIGQRVAPQSRVAHFSETLHDDHTALLTRSVITGEKNLVGGGFLNAKVNASGELTVDPSGYPDGLTSGWSKQLVTQHDVQVAVLWPHGVNTRVLSTANANGGAVSSVANNQNAALTTSTHAAGQAVVYTTGTARFTPQQAVRAVFTTRGFTCVTGNRKVIGVGTDSLGYFVGCDPATGEFGVMYRNGTGDHWIPRSAWNGYRFDGTVGQPTPEVFDPSLTGFYFIDYRMGTGLTQFMLGFPGKEPMLIHELKWRNTAGGSGVTEGFLPLRAECVNVGSTADNELRIGPMAILSEVGSDPVGVNWAYSVRKNSVPDATPTNLFTLRNNATWNGTGGPIPNRVRLRLQTITVAVTGGGTKANAVCEVRLDPTVAGVPVFTDVNANDSIAATDTAGTTVSGGSTIYNLALVTDTAQTVDVAALRHRLNPGGRWVFVCQGDGAAVDIRLGASWVEEW